MSYIIKIENEIFQTTYSSKRFNQNNYLQTKYDTIAEIIKHDVYIPTRKVSGFINTTTSTTKKVSAFNCKFTREDKIKKELFSLLNKLTDTNSEKILQKVNISQPYEPLFDIILDFIKSNKKYFKLYIQVLDLFCQEWLSNKLNIIFNDNIDYWLIPAKFIHEDIYSNSCNYDVYCDYNKWKDSVLVLTSLYLHYDKKMDTITKNIHKHIIKYLSTNQTYMRHLLDPYIEQYSLLHKWITTNMLQEIEHFNIPSSSKFKIMNLHEIKNSS